MVTGGDGSIILSVQVDESGVKKGTNSIKSAFDKLKSYMGKFGTTVEKTFTKMGSSIKSAFARLGTFLKGVAGQILALLSLRAFVNFSREAGQMAAQQEANINRLIDIYGVASKQVGDFIDANARALGMSKAAAASYASVYGNLFGAWADQEANALLTNEYLKMTAVVASKTGRTIEDVQERIRSGLLGNTEAIEDLGIFVNVKTIEMTDAFQRMANGQSWEKLDTYTQQQIRSMAILEQATAKYGDVVADNASLTRARYAAAYEDMKTTWGNFVNVVLIPVMEVVTKIMDIITRGMQVIAGMTGQTIDKSNNIASSLSGANKEQKKLKKSIKETNKELQKSVLGFDELRTLSTKKDDEVKTDTNANTNVSVDQLGLTASKMNSPAKKISHELSVLLGIIGGALIAIGVLLMFYGQIGWGIGFIIAGAAAMSVSIATIGDLNIDFATKFESIAAIASGALLALGLVLLFKVPAAQPLALGMIVAGAGILAVNVAMIAANKLDEETRTMLHGIIAVVSGFLLAIGIIMLFSGISPLAIGLIITGAVGLAEEIALNPDALKEALQGWVGGILAIISSAMLVLGILLCVCGIITPISIGMIVVGVVGLVTEVVLNWDYLMDTLEDFFKNNAGVVIAISGALLIIGILLCVTGVGIPFGIAAIVAGISGFVTEAVLNWEYIKNTLEDFFTNNVGLVLAISGALLIIGILLCVTGVGIPFGIAAIVAGISGFVTEAVLNWDAIKDSISTAMNKVKEIIDKYGLVIGVILTLSGFGSIGIPMIADAVGGFAFDKTKSDSLDGSAIANKVATELNKINAQATNGVDQVNSTLSNIRFSNGSNLGNFEFGGGYSNSGSFYTPFNIPGLARGAVIPPNKEFLAVLGDQKHGTNIEAPLDTIKQAFRDELQNMGGVQKETVTNIKFTGSLAQLARVLKPEIERETMRQGTELISGGTY